MSHNTIINTLAWIVTVAGGVACLASVVGVVYCFATFSHRVPAEVASVDFHLHDTYYVIRHSRHLIWPLALCMLLSAAIMILGYVHTNMHVVRMMRPSVSTTRV